MPDSTTEAIDRFFDLVDNGVDHLDRALNRGKQIADKHSRSNKRPDIIDAEATPKSTKKAEKSAEKTATAVARKPHFYIVEAIVSGETRFVVTDGGNARTECATREFAEKILQALEKAP